ncbi:MAG: flavodoxin domain-containing protein [Sandaracinaceae bacterium]|nr:flavodoxin domain-containing protein [Sandaracinaceae bacterium]
MDIYLIVGSESGNTEMVADCVTTALEERGHSVSRYREGGLEGAALADKKVVLVCSSTTGIGDIPQNVEPLYAELTKKRPSLGHVRYGVIGLGDRNYKDSFLGAPKKWDTLFAELGATRVGSRLELDSTDNPTPDEDAVAWVPSWLAAIEG